RAAFAASAGRHRSRRIPHRRSRSSGGSSWLVALGLLLAECGGELAARHRRATREPAGAGALVKLCPGRRPSLMAANPLASGLESGVPPAPEGLAQLAQPFDVGNLLERVEYLTLLDGDVLTRRGDRPLQHVVRYLLGGACHLVRHGD